MGDYTSRGRELMAKADKKLGSWGMFGNKYEDASELLEKACNQFKLGKACECRPSDMHPVSDSSAVL